MTALIWILLGLILYTYFGYLMLITFLGSLIKKKVTKDPSIRPSVTLAIAAYNEEDVIAKKIENSLQLDYPKSKLEIVVVSDGSTDKTDEIVKQYQNRGVKLFRVERVGKTEARNRLVKILKSQIVVFSDATAMYEQDCIKKLVRNFSDPNVGMATGHLKYIDLSKEDVGIGQKLFWKYEVLIKKAQTNLGTLTGSVGCITAFRREIYSEIPANMIEDLTGAIMVVGKGHRVVFEEGAVCYEEVSKGKSKELDMRIRVIRGGMSAIIYGFKVLCPIKNCFAVIQIISHKVLRWLVPIFCIMIFAFSIVNFIKYPDDLYISSFLFLQIFLISLSMIGFKLNNTGKSNVIFGIPLYFALINLASIIALYKTFTSPLKATWEKSHR